MKDPEVIELRNRFTIGICAAILFCIPAILAFNNFFGNNHSKPYKMILQKENFVLLLESNKCSKCDMVKSVLDSKGVSYFELNIDKDDDYYKILKRFNMNEEDVSTPGIMFIVEGKVYSFMFDIKSEDEVLSYIELNKLGL